VEHQEHPNSIRTYKLRGARITPAQEGAIERLGARFILPISGTPIDPRTEFPGAKRRVLEIGSGMGEATAQMAAADPDTSIIAIEVHKPGVGSLLQKILWTETSMRFEFISQILGRNFAITKGVYFKGTSSHC
jgi:tRNA G46 methylase TrmB